MPIKFRGFDWQTDEDVFMDGYHARRGGGEHVTYERLRTMGTNGFQEPATGFEDGQIVGTKRLYEDGQFGTDDGRALFCVAEWGGLRAPGKEEQRAAYRYLINNGRANLVWQSAYLDLGNEFVMDRWPFPFIEMHPDDMAEVGVEARATLSRSGTTPARPRRWPTRRRPRAAGETFMLFALSDRACRATSSTATG